MAKKETPSTSDAFGPSINLLTMNTTQLLQLIDFLPDGELKEAAELELERKLNADEKESATSASSSKKKSNGGVEWGSAVVKQPAREQPRNEPGPPSYAQGTVSLILPFAISRAAGY